MKEEIPEITFDSTKKSVKNAEYYISKFLKARENLEEVEIGKLKLLRLSNVETEIQKMKIKSICIDPETFRVYIDPERASDDYSSKYVVEGTDGLFYPYRYTSLQRLSIGITTSRQPIKIGKVKLLHDKYYKLKNELHPKLWKSFKHGLSDKMRRMASSLLYGIYNPRNITERFPANKEAAVTLLVSKGFPIVIKNPEYIILSDFKKLYIIIVNKFVMIYSWSGYYDIESPMKLYVQFHSGINIVPDLINFLKDDNYESRRKIFKAPIRSVRNSFFNRHTRILSRISFINSEAEWRIEKRKEKRLLNK